jgi:hypothetical protein
MMRSATTPVRPKLARVHPPAISGCQCHDRRRLLARQLFPSAQPVFPAVRPMLQTVTPRSMRLATGHSASGTAVVLPGNSSSENHDNCSNNP